MLERHECIEKLSAFRDAFGRQFGITRLGLFGSVAREEQTEDSDVDVVVEVEHPSLSLMYELRKSLNAFLGVEVDLVRSRDSLRPLFKSNIEKDVIYV